MRILISTIVRDSMRWLPLWRDQIVKIIQLNSDVSFSLSVAQNDSIDGSDIFLSTLSIPGLKSYFYKNEILHTQKFGSVKSLQRVKQLAEARNKTLAQAGDLTQFDKLLVIESDIKYDPSQIRQLIYTDFDCISARSTSQHAFIYDSWGTRLTSEAKESRNHEAISGIVPVYATFNCLCIYSIKPLLLGARFNPWNERFNHFECDTIGLSEHLHRLGYHKHAINCDVIAEHL